MRTVVKKRLQFIVTAIVIYTLGFQLLPEQLALNGDVLTLMPLILAAVGYFVFLPLLYWFWIIKAGEQKSWKLLLIFSLSCLCARFSFPTNIADYFEFITYVRYPIIAILLIFELYLMVIITKGLWQARKLSGDPRIHSYEKYKGDDKKLMAALPLVWELATWYYTFPRFSKNHQPAITQVKTKSSQFWHWALLMSICIAIGAAVYWALVDWSEIGAASLSIFCLYSVNFITANYRLARHYSVYQLDDKLIINNSFMSFMVINVADINAINLGEFQGGENQEQLLIGKDKVANVELLFSQPQEYIGLLGINIEKVDSLWVNVEDARVLKQSLTPEMDEKTLEKAS